MGNFLENITNLRCKLCHVAINTESKKQAVAWAYVKMPSKQTGPYFFY